MTIDEKLTYIRKAIELGAEIQIKFFDIRVQDQAEKAASKLAKMIGVNVRHGNSFDQLTHWLAVDKKEDEISTTFYYDLNKSNEEVNA